MIDLLEKFMNEQLAAGNSIEEIVARIASMGSGPQCRYCGGVGTKLCDYRIARAMDTGEELICSVPLCSEHAVTDPGLILFCGDGGCETETVDFCHSHRHGNWGHRPDQIVMRKELYEMEKKGLGLILVKEPEPLRPTLVQTPAKRDTTDMRSGGMK